MLSRERRRFMEQAPWLAFWPGLFLTIVVYSLNMFDDAVRDLLDPRLRGGEGSYGAVRNRIEGQHYGEWLSVGEVQIFYDHTRMTVM